jgi:hypothetical protein
MEISGSNYLYTLALISITFAGFAVLIAIFRQMIGGRLSDHDLWIVRNVLFRSFIVVACAMLPPLLALYELSHSTIWRLSSLITAVLLVLSAFVSLRIRIASKLQLSNVFLALLLVQILTMIFLLMIALGIFFEPAAGHFAVGVTAIMLTAISGYLASLTVLFRGHPTEKKRK